MCEGGERWAGEWTLVAAVVVVVFQSVTRAQFANRMAKVEAFLNSGDFPSHASGGLEALAQALHRRCARVVELQGGRLRT